MLSSFLTRIGIMKQPPKIMMWGLDVAEITSLVYTLKNGRYVQASMSPYPLSEQITTCEVTFIAIVPSAHEGARLNFRPLLPELDGIVYLVDTFDAESFSSSKADLGTILADKAISRPILVLISKPDASGIANEETLVQELGIGEAIAKANGRVALFAYSLSSTQLKGYDEGFRWLLERSTVVQAK